MSVLERIRNRDPTLTHVVIPLNDAGLNELVEALSESPLVTNVDLAFNVSEPVGECEALLSYLRCNTALRIVDFECNDFLQLQPASPQHQAVLQAFVQTMTAADANHNVKYVTFDTSFLTADDLLSDGTFYPSLKRVEVYNYIIDEFSAPENQTIELAVRSMSSLEMLRISLQPQTAVSLLRSLYSRPRLQHLSVKNLEERNMETAHALSGVLSSTPLTRLEISPTYGFLAAEVFEIITQGFGCCPTLDHLELSCYFATETNLLQAARFFHQCSTVSSIRHLSLNGDWSTSAVIRSILSVPIDGASLPVTAQSIGASLQTLTLKAADEELLEFLATNPSRLQHLSIDHVWETAWQRLCDILPALIYLQELTIESFYVRSLVVARTAMLQSLRANGSLLTVTIGHLRGDPTDGRLHTLTIGQGEQLFTAIELRFVDAYCQRNRTVQAIRRCRADPLDHSAVVDDNIVIVSEPTCIPYLLQAMQPAQRMAPSVLLAHTQRLDGNDSVADRVRQRQVN